MFTMPPKWERVASREVKQNRKVRVPEEIVEMFITEGMDDSVFWNYETNSQYVILSERPLSKAEYQPVTRTSIYDENGYRKIRPPGQLSDSILSKFFEGNEVFYLVHERMIGGDRPVSVYLLTRKEILELLPGTADEYSDLKEVVLSTPELLPSI